jgi:hypothetical protein
MFSKPKVFYADLTVVSGYGQCLLIVTGLAMLAIALAVVA